MIALDNNKEIVRQVIEDLFGKRMLEIADVLYDINFRNGKGPGSVTRVVQEYYEAFPDFQISIDDLIAENDKVVARWVISGTHEGEFRGISPTRKKVKWTGIDIFRIASGKVIDVYALEDKCALQEQLGLIDK